MNPISELKFEEEQLVENLMNQMRRIIAPCAAILVLSSAAHASGHVPEGIEAKNLFARVRLADRYAADPDFRRDLLDLLNAGKIIVDDQKLQEKFGVLTHGSRDASSSGGRLALSIMEPVTIEWWSPSVVSPLFSPKFGEATLYISSALTRDADSDTAGDPRADQGTIDTMRIKIRKFQARLAGEQDTKKRAELERVIRTTQESLFRSQVTLQADRLADVSVLAHELNHIRDGYLMRRTESQQNFELRAYAIERDMLLRLSLDLKKRYPAPADRAVIDEVIRETITSRVESSMESEGVKPSWSPAN